MSAIADREAFLREFYNALADRPLEPDSDFYEPLYEGTETDPVEHLATTIEWRRLGSVQLFSGFRGTGKSTELRRLRRRLIDNGAKVGLCPMESYLNLTTKLDISDFLVTLAGAFGEALAEPDMLGEDSAPLEYWSRFWRFLEKTRISIDGSGSPTDDANALKLNLKSDPSFRLRVQEHLKGHIGQLTEDVRGFMTDGVKALRARHGDDVKIVLILDSLEQIRGTSVNAGEVQSSVEQVFMGHHDKLRFGGLHMVYTVPPWLKILSGGVEGLYDDGQLIPCLKVREQQGGPSREGLDRVERIIARRGDWRVLLGERERLDALALKSGGYLRDLFRLVQSCLQRARNPAIAQGRLVELAIDDLRNDYLPIANADASWLNEVRRTHRASLPTGAELPRLTRFFDNHLVLCYRNGTEWFDVHPIIEDDVVAQVKLERERASAGS
ncbi:hypothetical protein [Paraliomyxa miuraensis]|uniref:hypothetical protein n=1 Tax=Paraliomyxa miuraensis TaxID=376150 RepID=UPI00225B7C1A|nr:hypothetical protein [Paraliomyxa miuraensis]MCX4243708.1 hypothetical protein [Paraliomyxa miuraensis]